MVKKASDMLRDETKLSRLMSTVYDDTYTELFKYKLPE